MTKNFLLYILCFLMAFPFAACTDDYLSDNESGDPTEEELEGVLENLILGVEAEDLPVDSAMCHLLYGDTVQLQKRCYVVKEDGATVVKFEKGLADGVYRILYFEYVLPKPEGENEDIKTIQYGMGCRIEVNKGIATMLDSFDKTMKMSGSGTKEDPYIISCAPHLYNLTLEIGDFYLYDKFIGAHFKQVADISLKNASYYCKHESGWIPIGNAEYPFVGTYDGGGYKVTDIYSYQDKMCGVGLFGNVAGSVIQNLTVENADIYGAAGVGGIVGCLVSLSGERTSSYVKNCSVRKSSIGREGIGVSVGGVVGLIDMYTVGSVDSSRCESSTIKALYNGGGIVGGSGAYSLTSLNLCNNSSTVMVEYAGAGGIIGVADTLSVTTSTNKGSVTGAGKYTGESSSMGRGTGGICGGSGISWFSACDNQGSVKGYEGVGGIVGSTRLSSTVFNNTYIRFCKNSGSIEAIDKYVGGLCGESQFSSFGAINSGSVKGVDYVGGIVGYTPVSIIHNSLNKGSISGRNYVAGISSKSDMGIYAVCQNYGEIISTGSTSAGIVGLTGNHTMIHYCSNFGAISGRQSPVGGIVGEIGDPREWSALNIAEVIVGSLEIVTSLIGPVGLVWEHFDESVKVIFQAVETTVEFIMKTPSILLWGRGIEHLVYPHHIDAVIASIKAEMTVRVSEIVKDLEDARLKGPEFEVNEPFLPNPLMDYSQNIENLADTLSANEEVVNKFNDGINSVMERRSDAIEEDNKNKEIVYTVIGSVSIIATTAFSIGAIVASGGLATTCVVAGAVAGIVGGINSISKGAADYTDNVIILSQCVNAADISCESVSDEEVGGLAGRIYDRGFIYDCLNSGNGPKGSGGDMVGHMGEDYEALNCLSISSDNSWNGMFGKTGASISHKSGFVNYSSSMDVNKITNADFYRDLGWNIGGADKRWTIPSYSNGYPFPIPSMSEMLQ